PTGNFPVTIPWPISLMTKVWKFRAAGRPDSERMRLPASIMLDFLGRVFPRSGGGKYDALQHDEQEQQHADHDLGPPARQRAIEDDVGLHQPQQHDADKGSQHKAI